VEALRPTYQWKFNGVNTGTNSSVFTMPAAAGTVSVEMTSSETCASPNPVSRSVNISLKPNAWTGSVSNDWNNSGNWCSGTVPTATSDVPILLQVDFLLFTNVAM
jgi:hypothetical protein